MDLGIQMMGKQKELVKRLLNRYTADESVLGVILVGSTGKGYGDEKSDLDLEVIITEERYSFLEKKSQKFVHTEEYDLIFTAPSELQKVQESEKDEDHWWYRDCPILLDKTGTLEQILKEIARYDVDSRLDRLKRYYLDYWENNLHAMGCLRHKNEWGARIYTALAMQNLIGLLFNFNHRWAPKIQWAFKEIHLLSKRPADLESQIRSILVKPDPDKLSRLWRETMRLLRGEEYTWIDRPEEIM